MRYVLNKELPFTHKGQDIVFEISDCYHSGYDVNSHKNVRFWVKSQEDIDRLIADRWIIEKQPERIWVNLYDSGWRVAHNSKDEADQSAGKFRIACKQYQEVIE